MLSKISSISETNLYYMTLVTATISENSAFRSEKTHEFYSKERNTYALLLLNATSNFRLEPGTQLRLFSPDFENSFIGK